MVQETWMGSGQETITGTRNPVASGPRMNQETTKEIRILGSFRKSA
jgi:hypothetical protein